MAQITTEVPSFVKGEPGFAGKLNQLGAVVIELIKGFNELAKDVEALKASPKPATRTASTKAK